MIAEKRKHQRKGVRVSKRPKRKVISMIQAGYICQITEGINKGRIVEVVGVTQHYAEVYTRAGVLIYDGITLVPRTMVPLDLLQQLPNVFSFRFYPRKIKTVHVRRY